MGLSLLLAMQGYAHWGSGRPDRGPGQGGGPWLSSIFSHSSRSQLFGSTSTLLRAGGGGAGTMTRYFSQSRRNSRDRKSGVSGKSVSVRVDLGGRRIIKKKTTKIYTTAKENIQKKSK